MITSNFKDWTLTKLDKAFGMKQLLEKEFPLMQKWQESSKTFEVSEIEKINLLNLQEPLQWGGKSWNEYELENKFISPLIMQVRFDDREIGYFLERSLKAEIGEYELSGIVDGMIATGFREPEIPFFCVHEYKKSVENAGMPDAQACSHVGSKRNERKQEAYLRHVYCRSDLELYDLGW